MRQGFQSNMLENRNTPAVLLIGGIDCAGMAGLSADQRFVESLGLHACLAATALTRQTPDRFLGLTIVSSRQLEATVETCLESLPIGAVKIGLLANAGQIRLLALIAARYRHIPWVLDPVRGASVGRSLLGASALTALRSALIPEVDLVTPNLPEAIWLAGRGRATDPIKLIRCLHDFGARQVLLKGGHADGQRIVDTLSLGRDETTCFEHERRPGSFRGTGCALASTIAAHLALGQSMVSACDRSIQHLQLSMANAVSLAPHEARCLRPAPDPG